ncbi:GNAT family N-acetyltransferase [Sulfitobacter sp. F26204]|nr:GNAT family N-acetyltransferase [Sulfitobacter sp. F26204]MCX7557950.1 GNAT family N-acetyltransferase [Sulfitobacter sp. F26204]
MNLIQTCFAFMEGVIDPPSSMTRLTPGTIAEQASIGEVWSLGMPPAACIFLTPKDDLLWLGKIAVAPRLRGQGLARRMVEHAARRARALGCTGLALQARIELTANHKAFRAMGFSEVARSAHPGYDRPTSITFQRVLV